MAYASPKGRAFIDRELYLPEVWAHDAARREEARGPREVTFAIKPELARRMLARARAAGVVTPWVTGDEVYSSDKGLRVWLEAQQQAYVLAVRRNEYVGLAGNGLVWSVAVDEVVRGLAPTAWQRLSAGDGAKGPRLYEWARIQLDEPVADGWYRWLLARRNLTDPTEMAYYRVFAPADTPLLELVRVAGLGWAIEDCFETAKGKVGLDQYEVRQWTSWYRHITLALLAHAYLTAMRAQTLSTVDEKGR